VEVEPIRSALDSAVAEVTGSSISETSGAETLENIGVDSLDLVEIGMILEDALGIRLTSEILDGVETVDDVVVAISRCNVNRSDSAASTQFGWVDPGRRLP